MLDEMAERRSTRETTIEDGIEWVRGLPNRREMIPYYVAEMDQMSRRPWTDLVCIDDYFFPVAGIDFQHGAKQVAYGDWKASLFANIGVSRSVFLQVLSISTGCWAVYSAPI